MYVSSWVGAPFKGEAGNGGEGGRREGVSHHDCDGVDEERCREDNGDEQPTTVKVLLTRETPATQRHLVCKHRTAHHSQHG